jgi:hypothetical protein
MKDVHKVSKKETQWPADHVERRSVESLIPYARNARTHSDEQVAQIAASIKEWGWTTPVLVDETGQIIAGHGRVMAARKLGIEEIPVMVASGWSEAQRRAYVLADNKIALNSGWDMDLLKVELQDIGDMSFDLDKIGFSVEEMTSFFVEAENENKIPKQKELKNTFEVAIECESEMQQEDIFNRLTQEGYKCRVLTI